jgi:hypothetical protein
MKQEDVPLDDTAELQYKYVLSDDRNDVLLHPYIFTYVCRRFNVTPTVDLFASFKHHQLPQFFSKTPHKDALGVNAFIYSWSPFGCVYINPPWDCITEVLKRLRLEMSTSPFTAILILPYWPHASWWSLLLSMLTSSFLLCGPLYLDNNRVLRPPPKWFTIACLISHT